MNFFFVVIFRGKPGDKANLKCTDTFSKVKVKPFA